MLDRLTSYYDSNGILPTNFRCHHASSCSADSPRFTGAKASYIGPRYGDGTYPRLVFLSLDSGDGGGNADQRTFTSVQHATLRWRPDPGDQMKHWYQTHELARKLLACREPNVLDSRLFFAHVNSAKCCQNNPQRGKAGSVLFDNCRGYIPGELRILSPDILVTQGDEARDVVVKELPPVKHDRRDIEGARYETGIIQLVPGKQALWLQTYHPNARHRFHRQRKSCWPLYAAAVQEFIEGRSGIVPT